MELNTEKVIKGLDLCRLRSFENNCDKCPYHRWMYSTCRDILMEDALALINKLSEDNELLRTTKHLLYTDGSLVLIPTIDTENTCVSCDAVIPEGRQVCPMCENGLVVSDE